MIKQPTLSKCLTFILSLYISYSYCQNCENTDFEYGDFTNWNAFTGYCCGGSITNLGVVNGRHTIITQSTLDPNTNNNISTMPPIGGGAYTVKLGNENVGSEAERLRRSFVVNSSNQLFIYQYALVLEDPDGHPPIDKPKFEVRVFDEDGDIIDPEDCGYYQVTAGPETDTWGHAGTVRYKDWSTVGIDLSAYLGTTITIEFTVQDCGWGGHFGYAYLDASCGFLDIQVIGFCEGSDTVTLIAPEGFDEYYWPHSGETTQTVTIPTPFEGDSITVEVTNQSGCATSVLHVFEELPLISVVTGNDSTICIGQSIDLWSTIDEAFAYYSWTANGVEFSDQQNVTVEPLLNTLYEVTVSNANGCFSPDSSASLFVTVDDTLLFQLQPDTTICLGESLTLEGPFGSYSYIWTTGNADTIGFAQSVNVTPVINTTYYLEISNPSCSYRDTVEVEVLSPNTLPDSLILDYCSGDSSYLLNGPNGYAQYIWSQGGITQSVILNPYIDDTVQVLLYSNYGCWDSVTYVMNETTSPIATINYGSDSLCIGSSMVLGGTSNQTGTIYSWSSIPAGINSSQSTISISPSVQTTYILHATSSAGCTDLSSFDTVTIYIDSSAFVNLGPNITVCEGQTDTLFVQGGLDDYDWTSLGNTISMDSFAILTPFSTQYVYLTVNSNSCSYTDYMIYNVNSVNNYYNTILSCNTNNSISLNAPGGYVSLYWPYFNNNNATNILVTPIDGQQIELYGTKSTSCMDTILYTIDLIDPSVLYPVLSDSICFGDYTQLNASSSYSFDTYQWTSIPAGFNAQGISVMVNPQSTTTYIVTLNNQYNCIGDPNTNSATIYVQDNYLIQPLTPVSVCPGEVVQFSSPGTSGNFIWSFNTETSTDDIFTFNPNESGIVYVSVTEGDCSSSSNVNVVVYNPEIYTIISDPIEICAGDEAVLSLTPSNFNSANWYINNNLFDSGNDIVVSPSSTSEYFVEVNDNNDCPSTTSYELVVNPIPIVELGEDIELCDVAEVEIGVSSTVNASYLWSTQDNTSTIMVNTSGLYTLTVTENNCSKSDSIVVNFQPYSFFGSVPNVITPNGDLVNDDLVIDNVNLAEFHVVITNRWGNIVFETTDPTVSWNGKNKNNEVSEGVYFYLLNYRLSCDEENIQLQGQITVVN